MFWRYYEFSKEHPEYFALMFLDRSVPRISQRLGTLRLRRRDEARDVGRIQHGDRRRARFRPGTAPDAVFRILLTALHGAAAMRLCDGWRRARTPTRSRATRSKPLSACAQALNQRDLSFDASKRGTTVMIRKRRISRARRGGYRGALCSTACSGDKTSAAALPEPAAVAVHAVTLQSQPIDRFLRVTGSLVADEHGGRRRGNGGPRDRRRRSSAARA